MKDIAYHIELHDVDSIKACFEKGISPNDSYDGRTLFELLVSMYTRSPRFGACVKAFVDYGLSFDDPILLAVLLNDATLLQKLIDENPKAAKKEVTINNAYTPLYKVSLLHVCAEFNHVACARVLINSGISVNVIAGIDEHGFGGHTPIFHTVNQNGNQSAEMMDYLLDLGADLTFTVTGLIWGKSFPWETFIPSVNPISYAMMGLLPQMHRDEKTITEVVTRLMEYRYDIEYRPTNIPCKYLVDSAKS